MKYFIVTCSTIPWRALNNIEKDFLRNFAFLSSDPSYPIPLGDVLDT